MFFSKIYQKFSKISAVGLASFCLMRNWSVTRQIGIVFESRKAPIEYFRITKQDCLGILSNVNKRQFMH